MCLESDGIEFQVPIVKTKKINVPTYHLDNTSEFTFATNHNDDIVAMSSCHNNSTKFNQN
jgi:hypothetical protein